MDDLALALAQLDRAIERASPPELPPLTAALAARLAALAARGMGTPHDTKAVADSELLDVKEAAERLKVSPDWLYRRASRLPFTVKLGPRVLRFNAAGIDRWIRQKQPC